MQVEQCLHKTDFSKRESFIYAVIIFQILDQTLEDSLFTDLISASSKDRKIEENIIIRNIRNIES